MCAGHVGKGMRRNSTPGGKSFRAGNLTTGYDDGIKTEKRSDYVHFRLEAKQRDTKVSDDDG